ncbi:MAG: Wadjet anti-phage system protein JetD domain-containing protein [Pseudomarimonas sp.]
MKSPDEIAALLIRQWHNADKREQRLLDPEAWPLQLVIGRPSSAMFEHQTARVREHTARWRSVTVGEVRFQDRAFRSAAQPVSLPSHWQLSSPAEWVQASGDAQVQLEQQRLQYLLARVDSSFHPILVRQRGLWRERNDDEVVQAAALTLGLEPGIAAGRPLRSLALAGIDSKFIERNRALVTALLDIRFEGQASELGLTSFLDAADEGDHWLLVVPLTPGLLPFTQQRVRARELMDTPLPAGHIVLIENDRCLHLLPPLADTIAVLGSGLDLAWLRAGWMRQRHLMYWGDMDTWGLHMLARARSLQPHLQPLLMERALFDRHAPALAVPEPITAGPNPPDGLSADEQDFYCHLLGLAKGRLEQEFLPFGIVVSELSRSGNFGGQKAQCRTQTVRTY